MSNSKGRTRRRAISLCCYGVGLASISTMCFIWSRDGPLERVWAVVCGVGLGLGAWTLIGSIRMLLKVMDGTRQK